MKYLIGFIIIAGLTAAWYYLWYKPSQLLRANLLPTDCDPAKIGFQIDGIANPTKCSKKPSVGTGTVVFTPFHTGDNVYLNNNAPAPGTTFSPSDTVVYTSPNNILGYLHRDWYTGQSIGTFVGEQDGYYIIKVNNLQLYFYNGRVYSLGVGHTGARNVLFLKNYLSNTPN